MRIIEPGYKILTDINGKAILQHIELAARTCYKSEGEAAKDSARSLIKRLIESKHESVLEHTSITVQITCDRGITHELVRHRHSAFSQESTRYANYSKKRFGNEITVIRPKFFSANSLEFDVWEDAMLTCESIYLSLLKLGATAQEARCVLPNSLKADIIITTNLREWRHLFTLRCSKAAHPQMRQIMLPLLEEFHEKIPVIFDDLHTLYIG